jgi:hypothetical protein
VRNIYELCIDYIIAYATQRLSHPLERRRSISRNAALRRASAFMIIRSMGSSFSLFAKKTSAVIDSTARPVAASWSTCPIAPVYQCRESLGQAAN